MEENNAVIAHRVIELNGQGRPILEIALDNGEVIDWNALPFVQKERILLALTDDGRAETALRLKRAEAYGTTDPEIANALYQCGSCGHVQWAAILDKGVTPLNVPCPKCKNPLAASVGLYAEGEETEELTNIMASRRLPSFIFRYSTREEYEDAPLELKTYLREGGLYIQKVKQRKNKKKG